MRGTLGVCAVITLFIALVIIVLVEVDIKAFSLKSMRFLRTNKMCLFNYVIITQQIVIAQTDPTVNHPNPVNSV